MSVRIGNAAGFWGDYPDATERLLDGGELDYIQFEYLAEVTMGVLGKMRESDPERGYATDFTRFVVEDYLPDILASDTTVVTNAGGVNPRACAEAVQDIAAEQGLDVSVATVSGDEVTGRLEELDQKFGLEHFETGEPFSPDPTSVTAAVAYLGAFPVAEALSTDADVIITGRIADPALTLGPLIHEYGWTADDHDLLAAGVVAGHLIECGTQVTGGNFQGEWRSIDFEDLGYPIVDVASDGTFELTKPAETGGRVSVETVSEQLIYEIADPEAYLTPDVCADFTSVSLTQVEDDRVKASGAEGTSPPETYKASIHYHRGYKLSGSLLYSRPDALEKAERAATILENRIDKLGLDVEATRAEYIGHDAAHGPAAPRQVDHNEIMLRFAARGRDEDDLRRLGTEFAPLSMAGPPSVTGLTDGGRPRPQPIIDVWPTTVPRSVPSPEVSLHE